MTLSWLCRGNQGTGSKTLYVFLYSPTKQESTGQEWLKGSNFLEVMMQVQRAAFVQGISISLMFTEE